MLNKTIDIIVDIAAPFSPLALSIPNTLFLGIRITFNTKFNKLVNNKSNNSVFVFPAINNNLLDTIKIEPAKLPIKRKIKGFEAKR
jgi:hypothetical protein